MIAATLHPDPFFSLRGALEAVAGALESGRGVTSGGGIGGGDEEGESG